MRARARGGLAAFEKHMGDYLSAKSHHPSESTLREHCKGWIAKIRGAAPQPMRPEIQLSAFPGLTGRRGKCFVAASVAFRSDPVDAAEGR